MSALRDRLIKNSTIKETAVLSESKVYNEKDMIQTSVPMVNVALSGEFEGGLTPGLLLLCGNSKMFKTGYALLMMKAYMDKYPDGIALVYDSEFGSPPSYYSSYDIDMDRVVHTPIKNIEEFKFDVMQQLEGIGRDDKVFIMIDSIGNLASKKEVEDALAGKGTADMTRAKQLKSCFRMITPYLTLNDIPMVAINHIYMTQEMFSKAVVSGGTGIYLSADNIWIIGRQTDKDGREIQGYNFVITIEKSRHVKEKSKIPIGISYKTGIDKYSGLLDLALEAGLIVQSGAWYQMVDLETGEVNPKKIRSAVIDGPEVWDPILAHPRFKDFVRNKYKIGEAKMIQNEAEDFISSIEDKE